MDGLLSVKNQKVIPDTRPRRPNLSIPLIGHIMSLRIPEKFLTLNMAFSFWSWFMFTMKKIVQSMLFVGAFQMSPALYATTAAPQHVVAQQAGGYSVQIGTLRITSLTDGSVPQDLYKLLQHTTPQKIDKLLEQNFQANPVEVSINAFLIELPGHKVLVDTGSGQLFGPGQGGRLIESLAAFGIHPNDITDILLTHAHSDHSGGLVDEGKRVFDNAIVHVGKPDIDFFFNDENQQKSGYDQSYFDIARKTIKPYLDAGKVRTFSDSEEVLPGITGTIHPGHTPGSAFYTLVNNGEKITFIGDLIHVAAVQFPQPNVTISYDKDPDHASQVRSRSFADFAHNKTLIAAPHLPFPGIGYVVHNDHGGYRWVPVNYTNRSSD